MFNSNSLYNTIKDRFNDVSIANEVVDTVKKLCIDNSLDFNLVAKEVSRVIENTPSISKPTAFAKAIVRNLDNNKFGRGIVNYIPNTQPLINDLRDKGIIVLADDTVWLNVVWKHILGLSGIDFEECMALNHKIIAYMLKHKNKTIKEYKTLLKRAKLIWNYEINWEELENEVISEITKWNKKLDELEAVA